MMNNAGLPSISFRACFALLVIIVLLKFSCPFAPNRNIPVRKNTNPKMFVMLSDLLKISALTATDPIDPIPVQIG